MRGYGQIKSSILGGPRVFGYVMFQRDGVKRVVLSNESHGQDCMQGAYLCLLNRGLCDVNTSCNINGFFANRIVSFLRSLVSFDLRDGRSD